MSHVRLQPLFACAMSLGLAGCLGSSRPARFYTLAPLQIRDGPGSTSTDATLAIGPVEIPDSIDRPQIVTRTGANELVVAEFDRWGSSLDREITASLVSQGRWELIAQGVGKEESLGVREATVTEKIDGAGYDALVGAMQRAVVKFGQQMAHSVAEATQMAK